MIEGFNWKGNWFYSNGIASAKIRREKIMATKPTHDEHKFIFRFTTCAASHACARHVIGFSRITALKHSKRPCILPRWERKQEPSWAWLLAIGSKPVPCSTMVCCTKTFSLRPTGSFSVFGNYSSRLHRNSVSNSKSEHALEPGEGRSTLRSLAGATRTGEYSDDEAVDEAGAKQGCFVCEGVNH